MYDADMNAIVKELSTCMETLQRCARRFEADELELSFAKRLFRELASAEHTCAAMKASVGRRIAKSGAWRQDGHRTPAEWMASKSGVTVGNALSMLQTAETLAELPKTQEAVRSGKLSPVQAMHIASAASANPETETELLEAAEVEGVKLLKERCDKVKAGAVRNERQRYEANHRSHFFRHWTDYDGAFRLEGKLTPDAGAALLGAIAPAQKIIYSEAAKQDRREPKQALDADALVATVRSAGDAGGGSSAGGAPAMVHVRVHHSALIRGHVEEGETCEIPGVGPVPVATAEALAADAFLAILVTDGADIKAVCRPGRTIPARLRTALIERDPTCSVPSCDSRLSLQIDHIVPVSGGGRTELENLCRLCDWHHYLKTHRGYRLRGEPGSQIWENPHSGKDPPLP